MKKFTLYLLLIFSVSLFTANAQVIYEYNGWQNGAPAYVDSNIIGSNLTFANIGSTYNSGIFTPCDSSLLLYNNILSYNNFFYFDMDYAGGLVVTIVPQAGYQLNITGIEATGWRMPAGPNYFLFGLNINSIGWIKGLEWNAYGFPFADCDPFTDPPPSSHYESFVMNTSSSATFKLVAFDGAYSPLQIRNLKIYGSVTPLQTIPVINSFTNNFSGNFNFPPGLYSICETETFSMGVSVTGTPAPTIQWQNGGVDIPGATDSIYVLPLPIQGGQYRAVVSNSYGTIYTPDVVLFATTIDINAGIDQYVCPGTDSIHVISTSTSSNSYGWLGTSGDGTFYFYNGQQWDAAYLPGPLDLLNGSVKLIAHAENFDLDFNQVCNSYDTMTVYFTGNPFPPTATLTGNKNICLGDSASLQLAFTGTAPWTYSITSGSQTINGTTSSDTSEIMVTPASGGTHVYTITSFNDAGCSVGTAAGSATVTVSTTPPLNSIGTIISPLPMEACNGTIQLLSTNPVFGQNILYSWNTGSGLSVAQFSTSVNGPFVAGPFETPADSVYVQFGALVASSGYTICVHALNGCGSSNNKCSWIRGKLSTPSAINGPVVACAGDIQNYTCGASGNTAIYNWTLTGSSVPVTSGQGSNTVSVTFPPAFISGQLCVTASLSCGASSTSIPRCITVSSKPAIPAQFTSGPLKVCPGDANVLYSVPPVTGAVGYNWAVPPGAVITEVPPYTNSIHVNFPNPYTNSPAVCVNALSACTAGLPRCRSVGSLLPLRPGNITANPASWCSGDPVTFSVAAAIPLPIYNWSITNGTIVSAQGVNTIDVVWGNGSGKVSVSASNVCGTGLVRSQNYSLACREMGAGVVYPVNVGGITIYPNPAHDKVTVVINVGKQSESTIQLLDITGRVVLSQTISCLAGMNPFDLNVASLSKGVYQMQIQSAETTYKNNIIVN